ncbi:hypothetical protein Q9R46_14470 [Paenibacillus sp. RRE4]|uniref:hypothetical protein n=1 Tax=Paenibacillus sp. RRE4 TaxID=2962587 RepID=UPI0028829719|nr:hypothetical protein [Paenibacillus sp. RRE4]MDT0123862.1 hypothetical protein [Paenibacillus sp. RRE4]
MVITIIVIIVGNSIIHSLPNFAEGLMTEIIEIFDSSSEKKYKEIFKLDDNEIGGFITSSLAMKERDLQGLEQRYTLPLIENHLTEMNNHPPIVLFQSPEYEIKKEVYWTNRTTGYPLMSHDWNRDLQDVFPILQGEKLHIEIKWRIPRDKINSNGYIEARQGDNIFVFRPSFPATYDKEVDENGIEYDTEKHNASFPADPNLVDYTSPLEIVVQYSGEDDYAVYELDFKKFIQ